MLHQQTEFLDNVIEIDASLAKHPISDDVKSKKREAAILQHIELLLMQSTDSCLFRPHVFAGLSELLFESWTPHYLSIIKNRIKMSLKYEPRVIVEKIDLTPNDNDLDIKIYMRLFDTDEKLVYRSTLRRVI